MRDGHRVWWVRGLACEMKSVASIEGDTLYINGWGFPQNQPGRQVATVSFEEGLKRYDKNGDGRVGEDEITGDGPMDKMLGGAIGFPAFDLDRNGSLDARGVGRLPRDDGGGERPAGHYARRARRHERHGDPLAVPATGSTGPLHAAVPGRPVHGERQRHPAGDDPATGDVLKQGRLKGAIDKYFASPIGADGKVFLVSQDGTASVVSAKADWEIVSVNALGDEVFATPAIADGRLYVRTKSTLYRFGSEVTKGKENGF